ncbi:MAG TPA: hypothetical protein VF176_03145 [Solirubrobacterales bacterium]
MTASLMALFMLFQLAGPGAAQASQAIDTFSVSSSNTQAGGHPDLAMSFSLDSPGAPEAAKDISVNTPGGVFGNPNALTKCNSEDFALKQCPSASQAGLITIHANYSYYGGSAAELLGTAPIYNRVVEGDQTALFSFYVPKIGVQINVPVAVRTRSDFGLRFTVADLTQTAPLASADLVFWGFPAKGDHDGERFPKGNVGCADVAMAGVGGSFCLKGAETAPGIIPKPLINNPSQCTGADLPVSIDVTTYQDPANPSHKGDSYPASTGCYEMTFKPVLQATATTKEADSASGLDITLSAPQPVGQANTPSSIHQVVLTLPDGFTVNPDAADGQGACLDSQANFGTEGLADCPDRSKIGTFQISSPALDGPLEGAIFIGEPKPGDQYRLFLIADGFGIHAKFVGSVIPDPKTGKVLFNIKDLPQVPFDQFQLHLFASDRGLMATPTLCTLYPIVARFFPWNDKLADVTSTQFFSIESGPNGTPCPGSIRPFNPRLVAGTSNPQAGSYSDFNLKLDRDDGDQFLKDINFTMPPGFTGDMRGVAYCPEASIAAASQRPGRTEQALPSCPASSQIGTSNVAAGPGSHPFHATGNLYMAGPFKGAPLSLVVITPALAGPYDYGTIVVRVALHVDPLTAQVRALSDTVPQIVGGIPIRMRSIEVNINRPGFTINPTNCAALSVESQGVGDQGTVVDFSSYFHAVNCATLAFKPKMTFRQLGSKEQTKRNKNPRLRIDLWTRPGDANLKSLAVTLPRTLAIDQRHLGNICAKSELIAKHCEGRQTIGSAWVKTPLLDQPLAGPVYAVSGYGILPHLAFILGGQVMIVPEAESSSVGKGNLQTVVPVIPDVPIGHFRFDLNGGKQGYLLNTADLCRVRSPIKVSYEAQNGKARKQSVKLKGPCAKRGKRSEKRHRGAGVR